MTTNNAVNTSLSGQTGTGNFVGATSPTLITPNLGPTLQVNTSNTSIIGSATAVVFSNVVYDSASGYNNTTGVYTVPVAGKYRVTAILSYSSAAIGVGGNQFLYIYHNGTQYIQADRSFWSSATITVLNRGFVDINCAANDTIAIYAVNNTPTALDNSVANNLCISRIST